MKSSDCQTNGNFPIKRGAAKVFLWLFIFAAAISAAPRDIDFSFGSKVVDGGVIKSVAQPDGKLLLVGSFDNIVSQPTAGIIRLNADGTRDANFDLSYQKTLFENLPGDIILQPDGRILAFGRFYYGGERFSYRGIIRLNANGTRDTTFTSSVDNEFVDSAALQPDGKIIIGGRFSSVGGQTRSGIARINADGTLDATFQNPVVDNNTYGYGINQIILQPDGKVVVAGRFDTVGGQPRKNAARLNADGSLDTTFQNPAIVESSYGFAVKTLALQPDGKLLIGGSFDSVAGQRRQIARLNADGSLDSAFQNTAYTGLSFQAVEINRILLQYDGRVFVEGLFGTVGGFDRNRQARLNSNGTLDTTFDLTGKRGIQNISLQTNGRLLAVGNLPAPLFKGGDVDSFYVREIALDGLVNTIALQPDNKILIGGEFTSVGGYNLSTGYNRNYIARLNADGTTDLTFNPQITSTLVSNENPVGSVFKLALQPDGKVVIAGTFTAINGQTRSKLARLNADGSLDATFQQINIGTDLVYSVALQADGKVLISGSFKIVNGNTTEKLARLNADGSFDATFQNPVTSGTNAFVSILTLPNGKILIGGNFKFANGIEISVARLNGNGTPDATFQIPIITGGNRRIRAIAAQTDDKVVISVDFNSVGGQTRTGLARLNADGTVDTTFQDPNVTNNTGTSDLAIQKDGKIIIVGGFFTAGGQRRVGAARINTDGTLDATFNDIDSSTNAVVIQPDGKIVIGGAFNYVNQRLQPYISRLSGTAVTVSQKAGFDFNGDGKSDISVYRDGTWFIQPSGTNGFYSVRFGLASDKLVPADYDGDGKTDIAVFRDGVWYILQSSNGQLRYERFGQAGDVPRPGDFDGDGKADIAVFRPSDGVWYRLAANGGYTALRFGQAGDVPMLGDYDGDARSDYTVYRPGESVWYTFKSSDSSVKTDRFGLGEDIPVAGDFDGDGKSDLAVYRPSEGRWYVARPTGVPAKNFEATAFGLSTDVPAAADYDGDGRTDIAVYRPAEGNWYLLRSRDGFAVVRFGAGGDKPLPAASDR